MQILSTKRFIRLRIRIGHAFRSKRATFRKSIKFFMTHRLQIRFVSSCLLVIRVVSRTKSPRTRQTESVLESKTCRALLLDTFCCQISPGLEGTHCWALPLDTLSCQVSTGLESTHCSALRINTIELSDKPRAGKHTVLGPAGKHH